MLRGASHFLTVNVGWVVNFLTVIMCLTLTMTLHTAKIPVNRRFVRNSEEGKAENGHDDNIATTTVLRQSTREIWKKNYCIDIAPAQLPEHYEALAIQHFGGGGSLEWIHKDRPHLRRTTGGWVTKKRCTFFHVSKCPFVIRELLDTRRNVASIEIGDIPHTSHTLNRVNPVRPGVPKFLQSVVVTSPARLMMHPFKVVASAREKGFKVDTRLATAIRNKVHQNFGILES